MDTSQFVNNGGYEILNPLWSKSKKNREPKTIISTKPQTGNLADVFYKANPSNFVFEGANKYLRQGITPNKVSANLDKELADRQSNWSKAFNSLAQAVYSETLLGTIKAIPDLFDAVANGFFTSDGDYQNPISNTLEEWQEKFRNETAPIYSDPTRNDILNGGLGNFGWWASNAPSVMSSLTLLIPATGVTKGLGALAKATKIGAASRKAIRAMGQIDKTIESGERLSKLQLSLAKLSNAGKEGGKLATFGEVGTNALIQRTMENYQEAQGVYKDMYSEAYDKFKNMTPEEYQSFINNNQNLVNEAGTDDKDKLAKYIAKKSADEDFVDNYANITFDIIQLYGLRGFWKGLKDRSGSYNLNKVLRDNKLKVGKSAEEIAEAEKNIGRMTKIRNSIVDRLKNEKLIVTGELSEGVEESVNYISQMEGMNLGRVLLDDKEADKSGFDNRLSKYLNSGGLWDSAFWGVMGGVVFHHLGSQFGRLQATFNEKAEEKKNKNDKTGETGKKSPFSLAETAETKARKNNMESWLNTFSKFFERANKIKNGENPYAIGNDDINFKTKEEQNEAANKSEEDLITDMAIQAAHAGNLGYLREFIKSNEVRDALVKQGVISENESKEHQQKLLSKIDDVIENYDQELEKLINIANNYRITRKEDEIVPFEFLQSIASQNIKYNQDIDSKRRELNRIETLINTALANKDVNNDLEGVTLEDLQEFASQSLLSQNLAELYAQRRELKNDKENSKKISTLIAIDRINKNIKVIEDMLSPANLRRATKLALTAKHNEKGELVMPKLGKKFIDESKEMDDILNTNLLDTEGNEIDTKRKEYIEKLDKFITKHGISRKVLDYTEGISIAAQNAEHLANQTKIGNVLNKINQEGIAGTKKSLMDLLLDKTAAEINIDFRRKQIVTNRDSLADEISFMNQTMQDARKKVIDASYKTITEIARSYKDNRNDISKAIGAAYEGNNAEFERIITFLNPVDKAKFKDAVECLNLSSNLNYKLGLQIEKELAFDEMIEETSSDKAKVAEEQTKEEEAESETEQEAEVEPESTVEAEPTIIPATRTTSPSTESTTQPQIKPSKPLSAPSPTNTTPELNQSNTTQNTPQIPSVPRQSDDWKPTTKMTYLNSNKKTVEVKNDPIEANYTLTNVDDNGNLLPEDNYYVLPVGKSNINNDEFYNGTEKILNGGEIVSKPIVEIDDKGNYKVVQKGEIGITNDANSSTGGIEETGNQPTITPESEPSFIPPIPTQPVQPTTQPIQTNDQSKLEDLYEAEQNEIAAIRSKFIPIITRLKNKEFIKNLDELIDDIYKNEICGKYNDAIAESAVKNIKKLYNKVNDKNGRAVYNEPSSPNQDKESSVATVAMECATQEFTGSYESFGESFVNAVNSLLFQYTKDCNIPKINDKYYGNFEDLLRYIENAIPDTNLAEFVYNSLLAYFNTEAGRESYVMTDAADTTDKQSMLDNARKTANERAVERKAESLKKTFSLNVGAIIEDNDEYEEALKAQANLKNGDQLSLGITLKNGVQTRVITVNSKDGIVGYLGIPYKDTTTGIWKQRNHGLLYTVGFTSNEDDNGTIGLKTILKNIINNVDMSHKLLNDVIHKVAFEHLDIKDAVNQVKDNAVIKTLVDANIMEDNNPTTIADVITGLSKLWLFNYKNKNDATSLTNSIDLFYDKLRDSYGIVDDLYNRLSNNEDINITVNDISRGELIRAKDGQNITAEEAAIPIQDAIGNDLGNWLITTNNGDGFNGINKPNGYKINEEKGQTRLAVNRNNGTVDLVACYPVNITNTYYIRNGEQHSVALGEDFNNLINSIYNQIEDRVNAISDKSNYLEFVYFLDKVFNQNKDTIFSGINFFVDKNKAYHFNSTNGDQLVFWTNTNKAVPGITYYKDKKKRSLDVLKNKKEIIGIIKDNLEKYLKFNIKFNHAYNTNTTPIGSKPNYFYKKNNKFIINIDSFNGKNGVNFEYDSFDDFIFKNNLVRVDLAKDDNGSNFRTVSLTKYGSKVSASFTINDNINEDNNVTKEGEPENRPVEGNDTVPYSTQIQTLLTSKGTHKTLDIAKLLITNKDGYDLLNHVNSKENKDILSRLFSGSIIFDEDYMSKKHPNANAVFRASDKKIVIGNRFMNIVDSTDSDSNNRAIRILLHENLHRAISAVKPDNKAKLFRNMEEIYDDFIDALNQDIKDVEEGKLEDVRNRRGLIETADVKDVIEKLKQFTKESYIDKNQEANAFEEFIVESLTNKGLMGYLNAVDVKTKAVKKDSIWGKILKFIGDLFGINVRKGSLREKELISLNNALENNKKNTKKKVETTVENQQTTDSNIPTESTLEFKDDTENQPVVDNEELKETETKVDDKIINEGEITDISDSEFKDDNSSINADTIYDDDESSIDEINDFNTYQSLNDALNELPLSEKPNFIKLINSAAISVSCR